MTLKDIDINTPEQISLRFKLAGLGSRGTAFLIDIVIIGLFQLAIGLAFGYSMRFFNITSGYVIAVFILIEFLIWWGYFVLFEFFSAGKTLGKMWVGILVIQDNGQNLTFLSAIIRNLLLIADFLPFLFFTGIVLMFFHPRYKRLGDLAAGTIVVHEGRRRSKRQRVALNKEIEKRGMDLDQLLIDDWTKKKVTSKEWELLKTYVERRNALAAWEREKLTKQVAAILFPILNLSLDKKSEERLETELLTLYIQLREDWAYEF